MIVKCCGTCVHDERFEYTVPGCGEEENEAYFNNGLDCNKHLFADDETLKNRFSVRNDCDISGMIVSSMYLDCASCKFCVINGGGCFERKVSCMGYKGVE